MFKKDPIFWWATGIFILSLLLFWITQNQFCLALMILAYLLRPTLASLGAARRYVDERQLSIHYRSSNIGFVVMLITCVVFAMKLASEGNSDWDIFNLVIIIGLVSKALFSVVLSENLREAATKIIITVGLLITLFNMMGSWDHGLSIVMLMNLLPGLAITGMGILSKYYPRLIGGVVLLAACGLEFIILKRGFTWGAIGAALVIGVPLAVAVVGLIRQPAGNAAQDAKTA